MPGRQTPHRIIWTISRKFRLVAGALLLLEVLSGRPAFAGPLPQAANFHHTKWTSENGLGDVFDIKQSPDRYLWLTTSRGCSASGVLPDDLVPLVVVREEV